MPMVTGSPMSQHDAIQELIKIQKQDYEEGSKYTQLILGLGYAGFFAVWGGNTRSADQVSGCGVCSFDGSLSCRVHRI
jgi:hypothetical protein